MENLIIEATRGTPQINFDAQKKLLKLEGQSYPENAFKFYEPVFNWIDEYIEKFNSETLKVEISLRYANTSSSKCILMILDKFEEAFVQGLILSLDWYCNLENESELETAEEFKEDISFPFNIISI